MLMYASHARVDNGASDAQSESRKVSAVVFKRPSISADAPLEDFERRNPEIRGSKVCMKERMPESPHLNNVLRRHVVSQRPLGGESTALSVHEKRMSRIRMEIGRRRSCSIETPLYTRQLTSISHFAAYTRLQSARSVL